MSSPRSASLVGAILVSALAARRIVMHNVIVPVPLSVLLAVGTVLWVAYIGIRIRDDIRKETQAIRDGFARRDTELMLDVLDAKQPVLRRVK